MTDSVQSEVPIQPTESDRTTRLEQKMNMPIHERVSSRLLKKEQNKILKQTIWFVIGGVVLVLIFLFLVLPMFIRIISSVLNTNPIPEEETVILQSPVLVATVPATYSAELVVKGVGQPSMQHIFVVNGSAGPEVTADDAGNFESSIPLQEGENAIAAYVQDDAGNESEASREYRIVRDSELPALEVLEPPEGKQFGSKEKLITISGTTEPEAKLYLNGRFFLPRADGTFSTTHSLTQGDNKLTLQAIDAAGNTSQVERTVKLQ